MSTSDTAGRITATRQDILTALDEHERPVGKNSLAITTVFLATGKQPNPSTPGETIGHALRRYLNMGQFEKDLQAMVDDPSCPAMTVTLDQYRDVTGRRFETAKSLYVSRERWVRLLTARDDAAKQARIDAVRREAEQIVLQRHQDEIETEIKLIEGLYRIHRS